MKLTNVFLNIIISTSLGCASYMPKKTTEYTIYYNDPMITHTVQPWPLESKAKKNVSS